MTEKRQKNQASIDLLNAKDKKILNIPAQTTTHTESSMKNEIIGDIGGSFNNAEGGLDLNDIFEGEMGEQNAVLKELFSAKDVEVKTELSANQIKIISLLELKARLIGSQELSFVVKKFETLQISKERASRKEFVGSFQGIDESSKTANLLTKFGGIFKNDK